jgi:hypothetical protein
MKRHPLRPISQHTQLVLDQSIARRELDCAWQQYRQSTIRHYKNGLSFGSVCYEWRARYKAQGSRRGLGFDHVLEQLCIPKTTAYRWIKRFEAKCAFRDGRNEVRLDQGPAALSERREKRLSFHFVLTEEQHREVEEHIDVLGGHNRVSDMILEFIREKALETRVVSSTREPIFAVGDVKHAA